jgi:hypothetical protein
MIDQRFRPMVFGLVAAIIVVFLYIAFQGIDHATKAKLTIVTAPSSATVKIDGIEAKQGLNYVSSGKHTIEASLSGFETVTKDVTAENRQTQDIKLILSTNSEEGRQYLADNPQYQHEKEELGSQGFSDISQRLDQKYPFLSLLPLQGQRFSVTQGSAQHSKDTPDDPSIALYITATDAGERRSALDYISTDLSISPSDVEIIFNDYTNPFAGDIGE